MFAAVLADNNDIIIATIINSVDNAVTQMYVTVILLFKFSNEDISVSTKNDINSIIIISMK